MALTVNMRLKNLIKPADPVLVIKNEGKMKTTFMSWGLISP